MIRSIIATGDLEPMIENNCKLIINNIIIFLEFQSHLCLLAPKFCILLVCCLLRYIQMPEGGCLFREEHLNIKTYLVSAHDSVANQGAKSARLEMLLNKELEGVKFFEQPDSKKRFSCHYWSWWHLTSQLNLQQP